jgi:hypothetical protein
MNSTWLRSVFHSSFSGEPIPHGSVRATVGNGMTNNDRDLSLQAPGRNAPECPHEDVPNLEALRLRAQKFQPCPI